MEFDATRHLAEMTAARLRLHENGYVPLANTDKRCFIPNWPHMTVDAAQINEWDGQRRFMATGIRLTGRIVAIDFDIDDADAIKAIAELARAEGIDVLDDAPLRRGSGAKIALFARVPDDAPPFTRIASAAYAKPGENPDDDGVVTHRLEIFGSVHARQFGVFGVHSRDDQGNPKTFYRWDDDYSLLDVAAADLPVITEAQALRVCQITSEHLESTGWVHLKASKTGSTDSQDVYDLTDDMEFTTNDGEVLDLAGLEAAAKVDHEVRLSASWLEGPSARNGRRCIASVSAADGRVAILETAAWTRHRPADMAPRELSDRGREIWEAAAARIAAGGTMFSGTTERRHLAEATHEDIALVDHRLIFALSEDHLHETIEGVTLSLNDTEKFFNYGGLMAIVEDDGAVTVPQIPRMQEEIARVVMLRKMVTRGRREVEEATSPPASLAAQVLQSSLVRRMRSLSAVSRSPILKETGAIVVDGFDEGSGVLVQPDIDWLDLINNYRSVDQALTALMVPFEEFPYVTANDRGAALAAAMTASIRASLPTAPQFGFDAPAQGTGKSLLAESVCALTGDPMTHMHPPLPYKDEAEAKKTIMACLMDTGHHVIYDNHLGVVDSAVYAAMLTSPVFSGRVLGTKDTAALPTRKLFVMTGNNLLIAGDLPRRTVICRLDAATDQPWARQFALDPLDAVRLRWREMVAATIYLIRAALPHAKKGRLASFEMWDRMIGQTVLWLTKNGHGEFGDPAEVVRTTVEADVSRDDTQSLHDVIDSLFGDDYFYPSTMYSRIMAQGQVSTGRAVLEGMGVKVSDRAIGRALRNRVGVRQSGRYLVMYPRDAKGTPYRLART